MRAGRGPVFPLSVLSIAMLSLVLCFGCSGNDGGSGPGDGGASDTDTNVDAGADTDTDSDSDGDSDADGDSDSVADAGDCTPTQSPVETTCDMLDNDCNGIIDDIDADGDGFCDCLNIGILGSSGYAPSSNFEAWLVAQGTTVTRTSLDGTTDGVVTPELLAGYQVLIIDRIERALTESEASAVEQFVKSDGRGLITLIGYNFDSDNPQPERDRANSALQPFGLAYQGDYMYTDAGVTPTFDPAHPICDGITDVNFWGGIEPVDLEGQGSTDVFAYVPLGNAGLAHQTADDGGRVVMWGDEWITFDSDWAGYADVPGFWAQMLEWVLPVDYCQVPVVVE